MGLSTSGVYDLSISSDFWLKLASPADYAIKLESRLQDFVHSGAVFPTDTGRSALFLALRMLQCEGCEVLVNAYTTDVVHSTIRAAGAVPVCFDIDPDSLLPNKESFLERISSRTKVAIHTGLFGFPCGPADFISEMARRELPVIEDICNSFGCRADGKDCGTFGNMAIASFRVGKPISSGGGALFINGKDPDTFIPPMIRKIGCVQDATVTARVLLDHLMLNPFFLRFFARPVRRMTKNTPLGRFLVRGGVVDTASLPSDCNIWTMGRFQSALALANLSEYLEIIARRRESGRLLIERLSELPLKLLCREEQEQWNGLFLPVLLPESGQAGKLQEYCRINGFDISRFHYEVPEKILGRDYKAEYPGTYELAEKLVCIPCPKKEKSRMKLLSVLDGFLGAKKG